MGGIKFDVGKNRWDLVPWVQLKEVVRVLTMGARKYDDDNWKKVTGAKQRYLAAALRHLTDYAVGKKVNTETFKDKVTGDAVTFDMPTLANVICCCLFLMWFDTKE